MHIFFIVLVLCEQGVCNVVKRLRFAGAVQLNNFTSGSVQNDCSLSYSQKSRVPLYKRPLCTSPTQYFSACPLQNRLNPSECWWVCSTGAPAFLKAWSTTAIFLLEMFSGSNKFEATKFEHNCAFNLSKSYFRVRGFVESWNGLENCATHSMCYLFIACPWNISFWNLI